MKELCSQGVYVGNSSLSFLGNPSMGEYFSPSVRLFARKHCSRLVVTAIYRAIRLEDHTIK